MKEEYNAAVNATMSIAIICEKFGSSESLVGKMFLKWEKKTEMVSRVLFLVSWLLCTTAGVGDGMYSSFPVPIAFLK